MVKQKITSFCYYRRCSGAVWRFFALHQSCYETVLSRIIENFKNIERRQCRY